MKKQRPTNLALGTLRFPITAITSILHRISGVILFISTGILLWCLDYSLSSEMAFNRLHLAITAPFILFILWGIFTVFLYHLFGGIRHIIMDYGYLPETLLSGRISAYVTFVLTIIGSLLIGVFLW